MIKERTISKYLIRRTEKYTTNFSWPEVTQLCITGHYEDSTTTSRFHSIYVINGAITMIPERGGPFPLKHISVIWKKYFHKLD